MKRRTFKRKFVHYTCCEHTCEICRLTTTAQPGEEPTILVDALWLAFADFTTQSLFAAFPRGDTPEIYKEKLSVTLHFGSRALLFLNLFRGISAEKKFSESPIGQIAQTAKTLSSRIMRITRGRNLNLSGNLGLPSWMRKI